MATHTLLIIDPDTLKPENSELFMRSGSLTALKKLSDHGFLPAGKLHEAGPEVIRLLTQEHIAFRTMPGKDSAMNETAEVTADTEYDINNNTEPKAESVTESSATPGYETANTVSVTVDPSGKLAVNPGTAGSSKSSRVTEAAAAAQSVGSTKPLLFSSWDEAAHHLITGFRSARHTRKTGETDISVTIRLDGTGKSRIDTGIPFYDHMLEQIARHGYMDLEITCRGDLQIDEHHTIEDTSITLGEAIAMALGDKRGIGRYGFVVAMDETRSLAAIDLSGRPWCVFEGTFQREKVGEFPTEMTAHFFHSLAMALKATLHVSVKGENDHHQIEACFKALARCLRQAVDRNEKYRDILPSSKGLL